MPEAALVKRRDELAGLPPEVQRAVRAYVDRIITERLDELALETARADEDLRNSLNGVTAALRRRTRARF